MAYVDSYRATIYSVQMFFTLPEFRSSFPVFPGFERYTCWGVVELPSALPWFMVHLSRTAEDERFYISYLIAYERQLDHLIETLASDDRVVGLHLVRPSSYSGSASWDMVQVQRMWQASVTQDGQDYPVRLYEISNSNYFIDPPVDAKPDDVTKIRLVFEQQPAQA